MVLSRKRQRELAKLRRSAEELWDEQRATLDHASTVLREARRQASNYAREEVAPRVREGYETRVRPLADSALEAGKSAATTARRKLAGDVIPSITAGIGSALALVEAVRNPIVRDLARGAAATSAELGGRAARLVAPPAPIVVKRGPGVGTYLAIGLGVVAIAGLAYAAWRTLSADDSLWVEDMEDANPGEADLDDEA